MVWASGSGVPGAGAPDTKEQPQNVGTGHRSHAKPSPGRQRSTARLPWEKILGGAPRWGFRLGMEEKTLSADILS